MPSSSKYGEKALMAPKPEGFNLWGYLLPGSAILVAGGALVALISRRRIAVAEREATQGAPGSGERPDARGGPDPAYGLGGGDGAAPPRVSRGRGLMLAEAVAAALVGMLALWLVLRPLLAPPRAPDR